AHDFDGTRASRHDPGSQTGQIEFTEAWMIKLRNEHGRHAIERRASLILDRLQSRQWVKGFARENHRRAVDGTSERGQDAAKAVVHWDWYAQAIVLCESLPLADIEPVHQQISMREHGPLRKASGAGRVLDIHHIAALYFCLTLLHRCRCYCTGAATEFG